MLAVMISTQSESKNSVLNMILLLYMANPWFGDRGLKPPNRGQRNTSLFRHRLEVVSIAQRH